MNNAPITAIKYAVRDLHDLLPDDYDEGSFDVVARCSDQSVRHTDDLFETAEGAEALIAELKHDPVRDLSDWYTVINPNCFAGV